MRVFRRRGKERRNLERKEEEGRLCSSMSEKNGSNGSREKVEGKKVRSSGNGTKRGSLPTPE